jgi:valyl-tRNA synthetase
MSSELAKQYDPQQAQAMCLARWSEQNLGHTQPDSRPPYSIVIPPPNVTGALHMGHALNNTLQDVLIRFRRMQGYNTLWMPGTDHAGIATQAVVERLIYAREKKTRHDLGRDEMVKRIWQWKEQYEARILGQLRALGCSADWPRTRFTLDPICARAVREAFFRMFRDGYIYRGKRLVNWDTQLQTSVADDETYTEDTPGGFWTFRYPVKGRPGEFIRFSTTRPETMLGDTAVCVHPDDPRYQHLIGQTVTVPLVQRDIPIIADGQLADPTLGTGCVKVTPAHDWNDYACYQRHPEIGIINILNPDGTINAHGGKYAGLERYRAREAVIADMEALGLFDGREDRVVPLKYSDRSKTPIEPYLSDQWFVRMGDRDDGKPGLAQLAMDAVTSGRVKFYPERYAKTYLDWLSEKRDWCISRQLWWGHQIPVWYGQQSAEAAATTGAAGTTADPSRCAAWQSLPPEQRAFVAVQALPGAAGEEAVCFQVCIAPGHEAIEDHFQRHGYTREADVLDTWFSSALWPFSTFGWPEPTPELAYYYPTSTLVTSRDIITLWVARMVLMGLYHLNEVPFREVYITPKILDGFGETMSKSKGNGVDPLDIIERYGADALRFVMVQSAGETQDSRLPVANVCPHCGTLNPVKPEHLSMRTRQVKCSNCGGLFRPGGPWPSDDPELPTARQASERFELGRNFANKLWNAARFLLLNMDGYTPAAVDVATLPTEDRWILARLASSTQAITASLAAYRFADAARTVYDFSWSEFCDWYVEMSKHRLRDPNSRALAQRVLVGVLDGIVRLVQPIMPFLAETLWQALNAQAASRGLPEPQPAAASAALAAWPDYPPSWHDPAIEARIGCMQELVRGIREVRNTFKLKPSVPLRVLVRCAEPVAQRLRELAPFITQLAGVGELHCGPDLAKPPQSAGIVRAEFEASVLLEGLIDLDEERKRLSKQLAEKHKQLAGIQAKLTNDNFRKNAPAEVVQAQIEQQAELQRQIELLEENLRGFGA